MPSLVDTRWFLGKLSYSYSCLDIQPLYPFQRPTHYYLAMAKYSQAVLGDHLAGLLVGLQPDLNTTSGLRPYDYSPSEYSIEFACLVAVMQNGSTPIGGEVTLNDAGESRCQIGGAVGERAHVRLGIERIDVGAALSDQFRHGRQTCLLDVLLEPFPQRLRPSGIRDKSGYILCRSSSEKCPNARIC